MVTAPAPVLDAKPYVGHDPLIGYRYLPGVRLTLPRPGGGTYELAVNAAGIRSSREYTKEKPPGVRRLIVLGDSYAAGQFVSNDQRFSEVLERRVPGLEVINLALEGTGTDQQVLLYESVASEYEHDAVMILPFLQNIRRNLVDSRVAFDAKTGAEILRPKPRFELKTDGGLVLRNVPVPMEMPPVDSNAASALTSDRGRGLAAALKTAISALPVGRLLKRCFFAVKPWEAFPEYASASTAAWQLMEALLRRLRASAGARPLFIIPVFYDSYVKLRMATNYLDRFRSLESVPGVQVVDLLPAFKKLGREATRCFQEPHDCHWSAHGHLVVAGALEPVVCSAVFGNADS